MPVFALIHLDSADKGHASGTSHLGGKLKVSFSFDTPDNSEKELGPFAAGTYTARILAPAFRAKPAQQTVMVEQGKVLRLRFSLKPQGVLDGYIAVQADHGAYTAGAWPENNTSVISITLSGNGIRRTLVPSKDEKLDYFDAFTSGKDFCRNGWFSFSGLPEGEYTVIVSTTRALDSLARWRITPWKTGITSWMSICAGSFTERRRHTRS